MSRLYATRRIIKKGGGGISLPKTQTTPIKCSRSNICSVTNCKPQLARSAIQSAQPIPSHPTPSYPVF